MKLPKVLNLDTAYVVDPTKPDDWPADFVPTQRAFIVRWSEISAVSVPQNVDSREIPQALILLNNGLALLAFFRNGTDDNWLLLEAFDQVFDPFEGEGEPDPEATKSE